MNYPLLKTIHQIAVAASIAGFTARGLGSLADAAWVRRRPARTLPHVVDTVLLASALALAWTAALNPLTTPWLLAKVIGLLLYIGLGVVALRPSLPTAWRGCAWLLALATYGYIASVAISKTPFGFLSWL
jgi:uncharacterized membrane protein SirB2